MKDNFEQTWEQYVLSWKVETADEKKALFNSCLDTSCKYNDPMVKTSGQDQLLDYMLDFHKQIPGGHFITKYFLAHSNKSIARWEMRNGQDEVLGDGISYGEYNNEGQLVTMTGFFETP